jgi:hypothetical protein
MIGKKVIGIVGISLVAVAMLAAQGQTGFQEPNVGGTNHSCGCGFHSGTNGALQAGTTTLATGGRSANPGETVFLSSYPNPFNPVTTIRFELAQVADLRVTIYDLRGREVARLAEGTMGPGYHHLIWDSRDKGGRSVPAGIYIARLVTAEYAKSIRLALLK